MHALCLVVSDLTDSIRVIGEEMEIDGFYEYDSRLVEFSWSDLATDAEDESGDFLPDRSFLNQNYPNPFNLETTISYNLSRQGYAKIEVFNLLGQRVRTLVDKDMPAGSYTISWDGTSTDGQIVATGIYLYRFKAGDHVETRKMLLMK
jgi:hypothetical protein